MITKKGTTLEGLGKPYSLWTVPIFPAFIPTKHQDEHASPLEAPMIRTICTWESIVPKPYRPKPYVDVCAYIKLHRHVHLYITIRMYWESHVGLVAIPSHVYT